MTDSVLFVCTANLCRSPTAEGVMRAMLARAGLADRIEVASAATHDYQAGMSPSPGAVEVASRRGYDIGGRARRVNAADFDHFDLILAMDRANLEALREIAPTHARPKIALLLDYGELHRGKEVPDPYGGTEKDYVATLELIEDGCRGLLKALARPDHATPGSMPYADSGHACSHRYLLPAVVRILEGLRLPEKRRRLFDLGCGNGAAAAALHARGYDVTGVDPSASGIELARETHPSLRLAVGSSEDDLAATYGRFPVVVSLEVVEHVYAPRRFAQCAHALLEDGGTAIVSTPYHGYWKNLALAVTGRLDGHFTALWDHGHIKFWSRATLRTLLEEAGFEDVRIVRVGRIAPLARSMIAVARRPAASSGA